MTLSECFAQVKSWLPWHVGKFQDIFNVTNFCNWATQAEEWRMSSCFSSHSCSEATASPNLCGRSLLAMPRHWSAEIDTQRDSQKKRPWNEINPPHVLNNMQLWYRNKPDWGRSNAHSFDSTSRSISHLVHALTPRGLLPAFYCKNHQSNRQFSYALLQIYTFMLSVDVT